MGNTEIERGNRSKTPMSPQETRGLLRDLFEFVFDMWFNYRCKGDRGAELKKRLNDALDAPRRNCDVGTVDQREKRFNAFCYRNRCQTCPVVSIGCGVGKNRCVIAWSDLPYERDLHGKRKGNTAAEREGEQ